MAIPNTSYDVHILDTLFKKSKRIFIIGIGGISLSSIAKYCVNMGKIVFGYDAKRTPICEALEQECHIKYYSSTDSVQGMDLVIYTTAIDKSNFEYASISMYESTVPDFLLCIILHLSSGLVVCTEILTGEICISIILSTSRSVRLVSVM